MLNNTLIPVLCARVGAPVEDSRGGSPAIAGRPQLPAFNAPLLRIRPTLLAAAFVKAVKISHMISVLIDHDGDGQEDRPMLSGRGVADAG